MASSFKFLKAETFKHSSDYIQRKRQIKALTGREDPTMNGIKRASANTDLRKHKSWLLNIANAEATIVFSLGYSALSHTRDVVESENKYATKLLELLDQIYNKFFTQANADLQAKMNHFCLWKKKIGIYIFLLS